MIGIGIDTGGTCTDAVVYDTEHHKVLSSAKTLTTKQDLKIGILNALKGLNADDIKKASYISLSTTLATNACVENKGGRAKLIMIGVNPKVVARMQGIYGLPKVEEIYFMPGDPEEKDPALAKPPWKEFIRDMDKFRGYDSVAIVQINPKYNAGRFEIIAEKIIKKHLGISCVRGYDLYQEINVQKRGATALLNAKLLPVMNDFFDAIEKSLAEMSIDLPMVIVKSDGSVMSKEYAESRPVETLLCGPAASVIGAMELADAEDAMIIDMGGTTSDIAMLKGGKTVSTLSGIRIGEWSTMVKGISIDTFALGGDSGVKYQNGVLYLDERRMIPLCMLASQYPEIEKRLKAIIGRKMCFSYPAHEFFVLMNKPKELSGFFPKEQKLIEALESGPLSFEAAAEAVGASPFVFKMQRLENEGIIMRSGITPTDIMHLRGDYTAFNTEASRLGVAYLTMATDLEEEEICDRVYGMVRNRLYGNLVRILLKHETGHELDEEEEKNLKKLTSLIYKMKDREGAFVNAGFGTASSLIGVGGPTGIFLEEVAKLLGTDAIIPEWGKIANAIGAAAGNITCKYSVVIEPEMNRGLGKPFCLMGPNGFEGFREYDEALETAKRLAEEAVREKALKQGARGMIDVKLHIDEDFYQIKEGKEAVFVQTVVSAEAVSALV